MSAMPSFKGDIGDSALITETAGWTYKPRAVINFAAESHVDRSIHMCGGFYPD